MSKPTCVNCKENNRRAKRGAQAIRIYAKSINSQDEPDETNLTDLLADLMHFADLKGLDYDRAQAMARDHHVAEVTGKEIDELRIAT